MQEVYPVFFWSELKFVSQTPFNHLALSTIHSLRFCAHLLAWQHFEEIEPPTLVNIFPEFEPMSLPLPLPMPADPPLQHLPDEEEDEYYEYDDEDDLFLEDFESYW